MDKLFYSIGEVGKMLNLNPSLIRFWEKEIGGFRLRTNKRGRRQYKEEDIERLRYLHFLIKEQGYTIEGAKKLLRQKESENKETFETLKTLEKIRGLLVELKEKV